jgi:hypothetical protein
MPLWIGAGAQVGLAHHDGGMRLSGAVGIIARRRRHAGARHLHRHAVGLLALPAIELDKERQEALEGLIGSS